VSFDVTITAETGHGYVAFLRENLAAARDALQRQCRRRLPLSEMSLALVGDRRMSDLHGQFMGIHGPTDVLSFPIDENARGEVTSGEVVVCVSEAKRQAKARKISPRVELLLYAVHGMLHLLGYDDRTARDFHAMHRTEDEILTRLGFGPVFAGAEAVNRRNPEGALASPGASRRKRATQASPLHLPRRTRRPCR
jgi:probable rRNA maturation factor